MLYILTAVQLQCNLHAYFLSSALLLMSLITRQQPHWERAAILLYFILSTIFLVFPIRCPGYNLNVSVPELPELSIILAIAGALTSRTKFV